MVVLFDRARSFGRDAHGAVREEGDTRLASQISRINPGDQWGDRCRNQITLTSKTFHPKMGTTKDRNSKDLTEADEIKKRCSEYTQELYKKDLNDPDNHDGVVTHPGPNILDCGVKWVLGSTAANKASEGDGISAELFKILKDYAIKMLHKICQQIWKTQQWSQDWKRSVLIPIPKKGSTKEC